MQANSATVARQRRRVQMRIDNADAYGLLNLLTGPQLLDEVESELPEHRERLFPPTETLPDTAENQEAYPQPGSQRPSLGFPQMRLVALLCLASGALLDALPPSRWSCWEYR
jgi:hypothetical protein